MASGGLRGEPSSDEQLGNPSPLSSWPDGATRGSSPSYPSKTAQPDPWRPREHPKPPPAFGDFPLALELRASDAGVVRRTPRGGKSATEFSGRVLNLVLVSRETRRPVFIARGDKGWIPRGCCGVLVAPGIPAGCAGDSCNRP
jgi:hypothetical protein